MQRNLRLSPFLLRQFPPTGFNANNRSRATGFAGRAARSAAKTWQTDRQMNAFIFRLASRFSLPGNSFGAIGQTGGHCLFCAPEPVRQKGSRAQAGPGEELESEELSNVPLAALNFQFPSWLLKSYQIWDEFFVPAKRNEGIRGSAGRPMHGQNEKDAQRWKILKEE